jgi:hypothetical protein
MPSPFPGMNPYLEQDDAWHDFHKSFMVALAAAVGRGLANYYIVKILSHVYIHELPADCVANRRGAGLAGRMGFPTVDVEKLPYLEIRDWRDKRVVTVIELLSPANKNSGADREQYLSKRGELLASRTHLVEIDLLRGGPRMPSAGTLPECDYCVMIGRADSSHEAGLWPIRLRDPLPTIPIPLRDSDPDVAVDLQAVLHRVYDAARYGNYIYESSPYPALSATDDAWARQVAGLP